MTETNVTMSLDRFKELEAAEKTLQQMTDRSNPENKHMIVMTYGGTFNFFPIESRYTTVLMNFKNLLERSGINVDYPEQLL